MSASNTIVGSVRAKMRCTEVAKRSSAYGVDGKVDSGEVKLSAVMGPGNEGWTKFTPNGQVTLSITNPAAFELFIPGKNYYVTFDPAESEPAVSTNVRPDVRPHCSSDDKK